MAPRITRRSVVTTTLVAAVAASMYGCGTARFAGTENAERSQLATISGDAKVGVLGNTLALGNAVVHLLAVDDQQLGSKDSKAVVEPGKHTITARCSVPARDAISTDQLSFDAQAGVTYSLQLRLLSRAPGCATELVRSDTGDVVARPEKMTDTRP